MGEVKLIATTQSLFCARIQWALKFKGVEYEFIEEDLRNKSPLLLESNRVYKKVPVLLHNGKSFPESLIILEYIDEVWKHNPLLPQDPSERALARFWAKFSDEKVIFGAFGACRTEGEQQEKAKEAALESLAFLEKQLEGKKFFGGEELGYLDLVVGWIPLWLGVMEEIGGIKLLEEERFPLLHEWSQNFHQIPLIKECLPPRDNLLSYFQASISYHRSLAAKKP
ncbi:probable glutathione S-transferase [Ziziphus jujuba]|uniref:glutathione transferase n=1 Tax=Ziziphus jujuba TaxID=326968 RepID=A0ABM4A1D0_ZIZJJ|nr:probable glutathione S-transferase [Ziziphus jujuba]